MNRKTLQLGSVNLEKPAAINQINMSNIGKRIQMATFNESSPNNNLLY